MVIAWYQARLAARPLLTQSLTTSFLFATGDITSQQLVERKGLRDHDVARTARMALYGGSVFGPCAATWYRFLATNIHLSTPRRTMLARVAIDQGVFAPVFIGVFLGSMAVLEGGSVQTKMDDNYVPALKANYALWPAVQAVNFTFIPLEHRVLFVNLVSLGWNSFLSYLNSRKT